MMNGRISSIFRLRLIPARVIKHFLLLIFWISLGLSSAGAQSLVDEAGALRGIDGLYLMGGDVPDQLADSGLEKEQVLARLSARLANGGVPILDEMQWLRLESAPVLFVDIREERSVYVVRLEVLHLVHPVLDPESTSYAVIWGDGRAGKISDSSVSDILEDLEALASMLSNDYVSNN